MNGLLRDMRKLNHYVRLDDAAILLNQAFLAKACPLLSHTAHTFLKTSRIRNCLQMKIHKIFSLRVAVLILALFQNYESKGASSEDVLDALQKMDASITNLYFEATWDRFVNGKVTRSEFHRFYFAQPNRFRISRNRFSSNQKSMPKAAFPRSSDRIFDGEKTVINLIYDSRNSFGALSGNSPEGTPYRSAQIIPGHGPGGPDNFSNPALNLIDHLRKGLIESKNSERDIDIREGKEKGQLLITYHRDPGKEDLGVLKNVAVVDVSKNYLPLKLIAYGMKGEILRRVTVESTFSASGVWLPIHIILWRNNSQSTREEWKCAPSKMVVNDSSFDSSVFNAVLEPGTVVWDLRCSSIYRVGVDSFNVNDYETLEEADDCVVVIEPKQPRLTTNSWNRMWLIAVNVTICLLLIGAILLRRYNDAR